MTTLTAPAPPDLVAHAPDERLDQFLLAAAAVTPERPAVIEYVDGAARRTTFAELRALADGYAADLSVFELEVGERVMIESDTSAAAIALLAACSSLGLAFIPVSPETPAQRVRTIAEAAAPALFLRAAADRHDAREPVMTGAGGQGWFDRDGIHVEKAPSAPHLHRRTVTTTDTAYIIFTSGTTGRPKGVVMSHRAVVSFYRGMLAERIVTCHDRVASTSPLQFDFSLLDIGLALGSGAAVVPVPRTLLRWPTRFLRVLRETGATQVNGVPSIWRQALRHVPEQLAALPELRGVLFCGENFPLPELRRFQQLRPRTRLVNCYGATESMASSFADVPNPIPAGTEHLSIGRGHVGAELILIDRQGHPVVETGTVGEMYLYSPALFNGYWDDPQATAKALVPDPVNPRSAQTVLRTGDLAYRDAEGDLRFCGRADAQVQIRGNRVEPGEIQRRLLDYPGAAAAAVLVAERPDQDSELAAFVVLAPDAPPPAERDLATFCLAALPAYMVPSRIRVVDALPTTDHGKTDYRRLAESLASDR